MRRQFAVIRPVIHLDGDSLILEPHSSGHTYRFPIALTGLISPFGNRAVGSRDLVRAWLASRDFALAGRKGLPVQPLDVIEVDCGHLELAQGGLDVVVYDASVVGPRTVPELVDVLRLEPGA